MDISVVSLCKRYGKKIVLRSITHTFTGGAVHAIQGDNGTGKSTLSAIMCGASQADSGIILCDKKAVCFASVKDAIKAGIVCVEQTPPIASSLTAKQNILLTPFSPRKAKDEMLSLINKWRYTNNAIAKLPLNKKGKDLTIKERFYTSLISALLKKPKVLILDESTALMSHSEASSLFSALHEEAKHGMNIIVITHRENEIKMCDDVFVMDRAIDKTIDKTESREAKSPPPSPPLAFFAYSAAIESAVLKNAKAWRDAKAAIIPTDRVYCASNPRLTVSSMLCAGHKGAVSNTFAQKLINKAKVDTSPSSLASSLSGGMLQRLIIMREVSCDPSIVIAFNPMQGLSISAANDIMQTLKGMAKKVPVLIFQGDGGDT